MCIPAAATFNDDNFRTVIDEATKFCRDHRAFLIVDLPPGVGTTAGGAVNTDNLSDWMKARDTLRDDHSAIYFPRLRVPDALNANRPREVGPSGTLAGVYARTDATRGVWKAPAGTEAVLRGADFVVQMTDEENGALNPLGDQRPAQLPGLRQRRPGVRARWTAPTRRPASASTSRSGAPRSSSRRASTMACSGWSSSRTTSRSGRRSGSTSARSSTACSGRAPSRGRRRAKPTSSSATRTPPPRPTRTSASSTSWSAFAPLKPAEFVVIRFQQIAGQLRSERLPMNPVHVSRSTHSASTPTRTSNSASSADGRPSPA